MSHWIIIIDEQGKGYKRKLNHPDYDNFEGPIGTLDFRPASATDFPANSVDDYDTNAPQSLMDKVEGLVDNLL